MAHDLAGQGTRTTFGRALSVGTVGLGLAALVSLLAPALSPAQRSSLVDETPVAVSLTGRISTVGLPTADAVSRLLLRNDGAAAVRWSLHAGADSASLTVTAWLPDGPGCDADAPGAASWSAGPLGPGGSTAVCVRLHATGASSGPATPQVTVTATSW